jgi:hypothetical protein
MSDPVSDLLSMLIESLNLGDKTFRNEILENDSLLHYTSPSAALNILRKQEIWFRHPYVMDDPSEFRFGKETILAAFELHRKGFTSLLAESGLSSLEFDILREIEIIRNSEYPEVGFLSFAVEEEKQREGRLSMWRAYGSTGVPLALSIDPKVLIKDFGPVGISSTAVDYSGEDGANRMMSQVLNFLREKRELLRAIDPRAVAQVIGLMLSLKILCLKHSAFREEKEWRAFYLPGLLAPDKKLTERPELIKGVLQNVYVLSLKENPITLTMAELIRGIIIGPSERDAQEQVRRAVVTLLRNCGFVDPDSKVWLSEIPSRGTWG